MKVEAEYAASVGASGLLRIMTVPNQVSGLNYNATPARELATVPNCPPCAPFFNAAGVYQSCQCNAWKWSRPTNNSWGGFSATAWYTGKALLHVGAIPMLANIPVGLIRSSWGGTEIGMWSSSDAVEKCPHPTPVNTGYVSTLFNGMISPFIGLQFSGVVWYQGESNTGPDNTAEFLGPRYYSCALPTMIGTVLVFGSELFLHEVAIGSQVCWLQTNLHVALDTTAGL